MAISFGKRAFDLAAVLACLPVWVPLVALLALIVMLDGGTPFYSQNRIGRGGRVFRMWKLRSMVRGADALLAAHLDTDPDARAEWDHRQKLSKDPRITAFGGLIRKTSLDELPQLFNVLAGDMSLVGPRPMMVDQRALYPGEAYFHLRPGITGPWQVTARHRTGFASRAGFDDQYNAALSFGTDLGLLLATTKVVVQGRGA